MSEEKKNNTEISEKKVEVKKEIWINKINSNLKVDYSLVDYSKYFNFANPIHESILMNNKFPLIKEFPQKYESSYSIPEEINIKILVKEYLNKLPLVEKYASETIKALKPKIKNLSTMFFMSELENNKFLKEIDESLTDLMGDKFMNLRPRVRFHENLFFYVLTQLEKEIINKQIVEYDMNILYWVTLFHDIGKFQKMHKIYEKDYVFGIMDKMHPFKSILIFIETLLEKHLFKASEEELLRLNKKFNEFKQIIFDSYEAFPETPNLMKIGNKRVDGQKTYNISLRHFSEISAFLKYIKDLGSENEWIYDASVLIIFHQNIPNNEHNMNFPILSNEQIKEMFDLRLLEMMRIIMYIDSITYTLFDNTEWEVQIDKQLDFLRKILFE